MAEKQTKTEQFKTYDYTCSLFTFRTIFPQRPSLLPCLLGPALLFLSPYPKLLPIRITSKFLYFIPNGLIPFLSNLSHSDQQKEPPQAPIPHPPTPPGVLTANAGVTSASFLGLSLKSLDIIGTVREQLKM